jgi:hypothetical protein
MTNSITVFSNDNSIVTFENKKGVQFALSAEGALFKGGAALVALKDAALLSAFNKARDGKYRSASDVIGASFPSTTKAFEKIIGNAWANKSTMCSFLSAIERAEPGKSGYSKKQNEAKGFVAYLRENVPSLAVNPDDAFTINA